MAGSAAQRAGLSRPVELGSFYLAEDQVLYPLGGHRAAGAEVLSQFARWGAMALAATRELCAYGALPDHEDAAFWRRTAVLGAVPVLESERFVLFSDDVTGIVHREFLGPLVRALEASTPPELLATFPNGQTAFARALVVARDKLRSGRADRALIVAADSLVHRQSLEWLAINRRLKTSEEPTGLSPSEASACVLVERDAACARRSGRAEAIVAAESVVEARPALSIDAAMTSGRALAQAVQNALGLAGEQERFAGDLYVDINGEAWNSMAWGYAQSFLTKQIDFTRSRIVLPCAELGDTGAASAALAVCLGTRAFVRGHARGQGSLVCSLSIHGDASAMVLRRP